MGRSPSLPRGECNAGQRLVQHSFATQEDRALPASVLQAMNPFEVEAAVARANRKNLDAAGRQWKIGKNVAAMVKELLFLDGHGEDPDGYIHKTAREWEESDAALSKRKLKTGEQVGEEEDLWEIRRREFRSDGRETVKYRLDMWEVCRVVVRSELAHIEEKLKVRRRPEQVAKLEERRAQLRQTRDDLDLFGAGTDEKPAREGDTGVREPEPTMTTWRSWGNTLGPLHTNTHTNTVKTSETSSLRFSQRGSRPPKTVTATPPDQEITADQAMKLVYGALKEADIHLSREEYAFNLRRMEQVLDEMCPEFLSEMRHDVEELVSGCAPYYWRYGKLDVLRAWREEWGCPESQQEPESREVEEYEEAERESPPPQPSISGSTTKGSMLAARAASGEAAPEEPDDAAEAESGSGEEAPGYRYSDAEQAAMIAEAMAEIEAIRQAAEEEQRAPPARPPLTDEERQLAWRTARLVAS